MTLSVAPDVLGAMRAFLMTSPQVASLWPSGPAQVAANVVPDGVVVGSRMVLFGPGGGFGELDAQHDQPRLDFFFRGSTPYEAGLVYRTVHPVLMGDPANGVPSGFLVTISGVNVAVSSIVQETAPQYLPVQPNGQNWPTYFAAYRIGHLRVGV